MGDEATEAEDKITLATLLNVCTASKACYRTTQRALLRTVNVRYHYDKSLALLVDHLIQQPSLRNHIRTILAGTVCTDLDLEATRH